MVFHFGKTTISIHSSFYRHPQIAKITFVSSVICTLAITFAVCYLNGFTLQYVAHYFTHLFHLKITRFCHFRADVIYRLYEATYTVPYIRVIPFQAGMVMGFMANHHRKDPIKMKTYLIVLSWVLLIAYLLAPIVASSDVENVSSIICSIMYSLGKFVYGLSIGGAIMLCLIASSSRISQILSHKFFVHLNKLCYGMFLVHPIVVLLLFGMRSQATSLSASVIVSPGKYLNQRTF